MCIQNNYIDTYFLLIYNHYMISYKGLRKKKYLLSIISETCLVFV